MTPTLDARSLDLRRKVVDVLAASRRGHLGSTFSLLEILRTLYDHVLRFDPARPRWPDRDRLVLSKGHGCLALYVLLADKGFFPAERLNEFCACNGLLGGHPDCRKAPGVEASTGSLGHGLPLAVGMALAARLDRRPSRVFAVLGDGECNEGSVWEAAMCAGKHRLESLCAVVDYNKQQSYDATAAVLDLEPFADKWRSFGFGVAEADGHDVAALRRVFENLPAEPGKPSAVICHTIKGRGVSFAEGNLEWHHKSSLSDEMIDALRKALEA